jgi:ABC-2 type transport system ATP-binding protein
MKLVTGQLRPSKGVVRVLGESIWGNPSLYVRIGFCPEQDAFYDRMTGLEWVAALVRLNGHSADASSAAARRALEAVDLLDAADKKIGAYSKGMRQRVKLAQAIVHDPELLILDEPLSGMDPIMRRRTIRQIKDWARAGKSVLVSSHILHEVEAMTSNILLINNGRIVAEGRRASHPGSDRRASTHGVHPRTGSARRRADGARAGWGDQPAFRSECRDRGNGASRRLLHDADGDRCQW